MGRLTLAVLLIALGLVPGAISAEERVTLSPAEAAGVARAAVARGDFALASALAEALLERDPGDEHALLILAIVAQERGDGDAALAASRRAWRADEPRLRYEAAMIAAQAHFAQTRYAPSRFWLRRAIEVAPGAREAEIARENFAHARRVDPLTVTLRFGANPSSNVNNGAESETIELGGLPFTLSADARELAGYEANAGFDLSYKLSESREHQVVAFAGAYAQVVWLTQEAAAAAPDVDGSDYNYANVTAGLRYEKLAFEGLGATGGSFTIGRTWYGDEPWANVVGLDLFQDLKEPAGRGTRLKLGFEYEENLQDADDSGATVEAGTLLRRPLGDLGAIDLSFDLGRVTSASESVDHVFATVGARVILAERIGPANVSLRVSGKAREYESSPYSVSGRHDRELMAGVSMAFPEASYMGFQPTLDLSARKVFSSVDLFDRSEFSASLGVASRF